MSDLLAFRRLPKSSTDISNYIVCSSCIKSFIDYTSTCFGRFSTTRSTNTIYNYEIRYLIPDGFVPFHTNGLSYTCWRCHAKIKEPEFPTFHSGKPYNKYAKRYKYRADTRRRASSGKIIGCRNKTNWGESRGMGKYYKKYLHKVERQYTKKYIRAYLMDPEKEPYVNSGRLSSVNSIVNWRND